MEPHEQVIRDFLQEHPEHIPGVKWMEVEGRMELMLDTETLKAFTAWTIRTGRGNPDKAKRFQKWLKDSGY